MALHGGSSRPDGPRQQPGGDANPFVGEANPAFGLRVSPPRDRLADGPVPPEVAYQLIHDELLLDGSARLNLATFVTTWMEPQARELMAECVDKNMIDKDEYPQTAWRGRVERAVLRGTARAAAGSQALAQVLLVIAVRLRAGGGGDTVTAGSLRVPALAAVTVLLLLAVPAAWRTRHRRPDPPSPHERP